MGLGARLTRAARAGRAAGPSWRDRLRARWHRLRSGVAAVKDRVVTTLSDRLRTTWMVLTAAVRLARAARHGVTLAALVGVVVGAGCHLCGPAVAATVSGVVSAAPALAGWFLRPLYPVLPLLASARTADPTGRVDHRPGPAGGAARGPGRRTRERIKRRKPRHRPAANPAGWPSFVLFVPS